MHILCIVYMHIICMYAYLNYLIFFCNLFFSFIIYVLHLYYVSGAALGKSYSNDKQNRHNFYSQVSCLVGKIWINIRIFEATLERITPANFSELMRDIN